MSLNSRLASTFTRLPPDGVGKRVNAFLYHEVQYSAATHPFIRGEYIKGLTSLEIGEIVDVYPKDAFTGYLWVIQEDTGVGSGFTVGEQLQLGEYSGPVVASCVSSVPRLVPMTVNVGKNDPAYGQYVDNKGAAYVRFTEGAPQFAPFGEQKTTQARAVAVYEHSTGDYDSLYGIETSGTAVSVYNSASSEVILRVDGASGSSCRRTTNRFHYYLPGTGQAVLLTVGNGDVGKVGNTRRWGYYTDHNGVFFELSGTTFNVVLRSNIGDVIVEERVSQVNFNTDNLDGDGLSGVTWDATKYWVYWLDLQWLGAGRVRMGVSAPDSTRVQCHEFQHSGLLTSLYMQGASLPLRWDNFNTAVTAGTSELKEGCAAVHSEGFMDYTFWRYSDMTTNGMRSIGTGTLPVLSLRSKQLNGANRHNNVTAYPEVCSVYVSGTTPVKVQFGDASPNILSGSTWTIPGEGSIEGDIAATEMDHTPEVWTPRNSFYVAPGQCVNYALTPFFETNDTGVNLGADNTQPTITFTADKLDTAGTASIHMSISYRELW